MGDLGGKVEKAGTMKPVLSGKVREVFDCGGGQLAIVATDRISAFDVIMNEPVPQRGRVLTALTEFWLNEACKDLPTHFVSCEVPDGVPEELDPVGRTMVVRKAEMVQLECIVRGYLAGSGWKEYSESGTLHGEKLPQGLQLGARLPKPVMTPSTKGELGAHDVNLTRQEGSELLGSKLYEECEALALELYARGAQRADESGFVLADTKFEFGFIDGVLSVCDEVMTPDSSRYWLRAALHEGDALPAYDKQLLRDWLEQQPWGKTPPPPTIPDDVLALVGARYVRLYESISDRSFAEWPGVAVLGAY